MGIIQALFYQNAPFTLTRFIILVCWFMGIASAVVGVCSDGCEVFSCTLLYSLHDKRYEYCHE